MCKRVGTCQTQKMALNACLFGFYKGLIDLLAVIVIPFIVIPRLDFPFYVNSIIGIAYIVSLKPIFKPLDDVDRASADRIVDEYIEMAKQLYYQNHQ